RGARARSETPRSDVTSQSAADARARDVRAHLAARGAQRLRSARRGTRPGPRRRSPVHRAVRGAPAKGSLSPHHAGPERGAAPVNRALLIIDAHEARYIPSTLAIDSRP